MSKMTLRARKHFSMGRRPMIWVFKTFSRIRGIKCTLIHIRATNTEKTAYHIFIYKLNSSPKCTENAVFHSNCLEKTGESDEFELY